MEGAVAIRQIAADPSEPVGRHRDVGSTVAIEIAGDHFRTRPVDPVGAGLRRINRVEGTVPVRQIAADSAELMRCNRDIGPSIAVEIAGDRFRTLPVDPLYAGLRGINRMEATVTI